MYKKQHYVPESYLKAWCDPNTPAGQEPYVWQFSADGHNVRKKAPKNIFYETDMYSIVGPDGHRNLVLEHGLSELESKFCTIRDTKIAAEKPITMEERMLLCAFMAAMTARTKTFRDHHKVFWTGLLVKMYDMMDGIKNLPMADRLKLARTTGRGEQRKEKTLTYDDVKDLASQPMQKMFPSVFRILAPRLCQLDMAILKTTVGSPGFITSDNPCVWFDPKWHTRPPMFQSPALGYKTIEIRLPISPRQIIVLNRARKTGYFPIPDKYVDAEINRITRFSADRHFIANANVKKDIWFDPGREPQDSWAKTQGS